MKSLNCIRVSKPCGTGKDSSALTGWTNGDGGGHGRISTGCGDKRGRRADKTLGTRWLWKKRKAARLRAGLVPRVEKRRSRLPSRGSDPAER